MKKVLLSVLFISSVSGAAYANDSVMFAPQATLAMSNTSTAWPAAMASTLKVEEHLVSEQQMKAFNDKMANLRHRMKGSLDKLINKQSLNNLD